MDPYRAISNLVMSYAERIDLGDFQGVADVLADCTVTAEGVPETWQGRDAVLGLYTNGTRIYPETGTPRTKHVTTNLTIEVDEENATGAARSYFCVMQAVPGSLALQPVIAGRYADTFARTDGRWRFVTRHMTVDLVGDLSQHLLQEFDNL